MSVTVQRTRRIVPWGPGDPASPNLPFGIWTVSILVLGDAGGGFREADAVFTLDTSPRLDGLLYNLEALSVADTENVTKVCSVFTVNMGIRPEGTAVEFVVTLAASAQGGARAGATNASGYPLLLGTQIDQGITSLLACQISNANVETLRMRAQGYVWDTRALSAPGGPRRPTGGPFGS